MELLLNHSVVERGDEGNWGTLKIGKLHEMLQLPERTCQKRMMEV